MTSSKPMTPRQFWLAVYMYPAFVPLVMSFVFMVITETESGAPDTVQHLRHQIYMTLTISFLVLMAHSAWMVWYAARRGFPTLPGTDLGKPKVETLKS